MYVYDGIPDFIDGSNRASGKLLGSFCGSTSGQSVLAQSRNVTIYFETDRLAREYPHVIVDKIGTLNKWQRAPVPVKNTKFGTGGNLGWISLLVVVAHSLCMMLG